MKKHPPKHHLTALLLLLYCASFAINWQLIRKNYLPGGSWNQSGLPKNPRSVDIFITIMPGLNTISAGILLLYCVPEVNLRWFYNLK
jgi:hypothetical protein